MVSSHALTFERTPLVIVRLSLQQKPLCIRTVPTFIGSLDGPLTVGSSLSASPLLILAREASISKDKLVATRSTLRSEAQTESGSRRSSCTRNLEYRHPVWKRNRR